MYRHLLSSVLDDWVEQLSGQMLVDYAVICRSETLKTASRGDAAHIALAAQITYDRALIKLCSEHHIDADVMAFADPLRARAHLERELADEGVDLVALSRARIGI